MYEISTCLLLAVIPAMDTITSSLNERLVSQCSVAEPLLSVPTFYILYTLERADRALLARTGASCILTLCFILDCRLTSIDLKSHHFITIGKTINVQLIILFIGRFDSFTSYISIAMIWLYKSGADVKLNYRITVVSL